MKKWILGIASLLCIGAAISLDKTGNVSVSAQEVASITYVLALDNYKISEELQDVKLLNPLGDEEPIVDGSFTAKHIGMYLLMAGDTVVQSIRVLPTVPDANFAYAYALSDTFAAGDSFELPSATVDTAISSMADCQIDVCYDGAVVQKFANSSAENVYTFSRAGEYTLVYRAVDEYGFIYEESFQLLAQDVRVFHYNRAIPSEIYLYNQVVLPKINGYFQEKTYPVQVKVTSPSKQNVPVENNSFYVEEMGEYSIECTADIQGEVLQSQFVCNATLSVSSYFGKGNGVGEIVNGYTLSMDETDERTGTKISFDGANSYVAFTKSIDLKEFAFDEELISFYLLKNDTSKISQVKVTMMDAANPKNKFSVLWKQAPGYDNICYTRVAYDNYTIGLHETTGLPRPGYGTTVGNVSFSAKTNRTPFNFSFDRENNTVYMRSGKNLMKILDLDDEVLLSGKKLFQGFTTDRVYLQIELVEGYGDIVVEKVGKYTNDNLPAENDDFLQFSYDGKTFAGDMYVGLVNNAYSLPKPYGTDALFGEIEVDIKLVKIENGQETDVTSQVRNFIFVPKSTGEYKVYYTCQNGYGEEIEKSYSFTVQETVSKIVVENENIDGGKYGEFISPPQIQVVGGVGELRTQVRYFVGEEEIFMDVNGRLSLAQTQNITCQVKVVDFLGQTCEKNFTIEIDTDVQYIQVEELPFTFFAGRDYVLPDFTAIDRRYAESDDAYYMEKTILVDGVKIDEDRKVNFAVAGQYTIVYQGSSSDRLVEKTYTVIVLNENTNNTLMLENYIVTQDGFSKENIQLTEQGVFMKVDSDAQFTLPSVLPTDKLTLSFSVLAGSKYTVEYVLMDSKNPAQQIVVKLKDFTETTFKLCVNDGIWYNISASKETLEVVGYENQECYKTTMFLYALDKVIANATGSVVQEIREYQSGDVYTGFTSGLVTVSVRVTETQENSLFILNTVGNHNLTSIAMQNGDKQGPMIAFLQKTQIQGDIGTLFSLSPAVAYDVLQGKAVSFRAYYLTPSGDKKTFNPYDGVEITLTEYGYYNFVYEARDYFGNLGKYTHSVEVRDKELPTMIAPTLKATYKVGEAVDLRNGFSATDNVSVETMRIYVRSSNNKLIIVADTFTFSGKGKYEIIYYACDKAGNIALTSRIVEVV